MPTYGFYPYSFGGTEVYISGLARLLHSRGHSVTIIAGVPDLAYKEHGVYYEDENVKAVKYCIDDITVIGVTVKNIKTEELYNKYRPGADASWLNIFESLPQSRWDIVHFHAFTVACGQNMLKSLKKYSPTVKVCFSYHLPVSCVKNTLVTGNTFNDCNVKPEAVICAACYISGKKNIPLMILRLLALR